MSLRSLLHIVLLLSAAAERNFLRGENYELQGFSRLLGFDQSSPELTRLFSEIDEGMKPIRHPTFSLERCSQMVEDVASAAGGGENFVHTGLFLPSAGGPAGWQDAQRKMRLGILSFLATQSNTSKLWFWTNVGNEFLQDSLRMFEEERFRGRVQLRHFEARSEFAQVVSNATESNALAHVYEAQTDVTSKSDLLRAVVLHNYGGFWMDTDVLLIRDLTPLAQEDFAYLGQDDFVNNAFMSTSKPRSAFMKSYLSLVLARHLSTNHFEYGPSVLTELCRKIQSSEMPSTFHVLPGCFFDGAWCGASAAVYWDDFFSKKASKAGASRGECGLHHSKQPQCGVRLSLAWPLGEADGGGVPGL
ncbi:unnamed protein product [Effrenium voratum]|uniref:Alpha-1,4-N-acetylglucosaminyltransferase n=1 Tax=Effrenium voratum TaxID=2562239 RepID=A0AA36NJ30_9DINO|nr:unnamed protein product [Effrenium voratum]